MPLTWKRKTESHGKTPAEVMKQAVAMVVGGMSVRETAKSLNISKSTLHRYVTLRKKDGTDENPIRYEPNYANSQIFSSKEESDLATYLSTAAKHHHGLTTKDTRRLAYEFATRNNKPIPESWTTNKTAGEDWFRGFMKRNKELSIRKPEATSLARSTSFNKKNVGGFF